MPELPEVETIARGLRQSVLGRRILSVSLGKTDFMDAPETIEAALPGRQIQEVRRFGKFLILRLSPLNGESSQDSLLVHLGMTGHLATFPADLPPAKHTHLCCSLDDGRELRYTDPRRFGRIALRAEPALAGELSALGADPLEVSEEDFVVRIWSSRARVKALLLNQHVLRGVGNIYADESLWRAKIHPMRPGSRLTPRQCRDLRNALRAILLRAIELRGSSISDFVDARGQPGDYQRRHRAYGREGKPCVRCRTPIRRILVAGRGSFFCPLCQPVPRPVRRKPRRTP